LKIDSKINLDHNILRETSLIRVRTRIMDPFVIDSDQSCSIIPKVYIVFSKNIVFEKRNNSDRNLFQKVP